VAEASWPERMHQQPFANVIVTPQVDAAHPTRFVEMGARTFKPLAALAQEPPPSTASKSTITWIAVIALVGDFCDLAAGHQGPDLFGSLDERVDARRSVALIGILDGDSDDRTGLLATACSALCARCVRPFFILAILASGSSGRVQSSLEPFFRRFRSTRAKSSRVGVSTPDACASCVRNS
jgi:hypothetical protein